MSLNQTDIEEIRKVFEDALSRVQRIDRGEKMKMRSRIRDETAFLTEWRAPRLEAIMERWEEKLHEVFAVFPFGFRDDLKRLLAKKLTRKTK